MPKSDASFGMLHRRLLKFAWSCLSHQFAGSGWTSLRGHLHQTCPSPYPLAQAATSAQALLYPYYNQPFLSGLEPFWFQGPRDSVNLQNFNMTYLYIPNSFMIWNMQHVFENKKNLSFMAKILGKLSTSFGSIMFFFHTYLLYLNGDGKIEIWTTLVGQPDQQCFHLVFDLKMSSFG